MDASIQNGRAEYQTVTGTIFVVGFVLYSILGVFFSYSNGSSPAMAAAIGMAGGYFFFSILSGLLWTIRFVAGKSLRTKVLLTVFFPVPVWLVLAGIFYSVPYGVYNFPGAPQVSPVISTWRHSKSPCAYPIDWRMGSLLL